MAVLGSLTAAVAVRAWPPSDPVRTPSPPRD